MCRFPVIYYRLLKLTRKSNGTYIIEQDEITENIRFQWDLNYKLHLNIIWTYHKFINCRI